jgi:hypothetical protein
MISTVTVDSGQRERTQKGRGDRAGSLTASGNIDQTKVTTQQQSLITHHDHRDTIACTQSKWIAPQNCRPISAVPDSADRSNNKHNNRSGKVRIN